MEFTLDGAFVKKAICKLRATVVAISCKLRVKFVKIITKIRVI